MFKKLILPLLVLLMSILAADDAPPPRNPGELSAAMEIGEFPAGDLFAALQRGDVVRMRRHGWNLFAGMTSQNAFTVKAPIFLSWYTKANLFNAPTEAGGRFGLEASKQLRDLTAMSLSVAGATPAEPAPAPVLTKVYYNSSAFKHIRDNKLNSPDERLKLNCALGSAAAEDRHIQSFPASAVAVKTIWRLASANNTTMLTPLPVWDPESNSAQPKGNDPNPQKPYTPGHWSRYVAVNTDPSKYVGQDYAEIPVNGKINRARIVPVSRFFSVAITASMLDEAAALVSGTPQVGDYLVLVGMHVTTKEIPNWVWATFWWHDEPDRGPFAAQRPSSVRDPWRNYLMNVSYDMNEPRERDGSAHINFNPYLEALTEGGLKSNCMTCHRLAASPPVSQERTPGAISPGDPRFADRIKLDFLWTLTHENDQPLSACPGK